MKLLYTILAVIYIHLLHPIPRNISPRGAGDLVINEILFNPRTGGVDYIEIYNRSNQTYDAATISLTNRNSSGAPGVLRPLSRQSRPIPPGSYLVATEDPSVVQQQYYVKDTAAFVKVSPMPSYPNTSGTVVLIQGTSLVLDEVQYTEKWHFSLIQDAKGVSLEKIDFNKSSQDQNNWHSAAGSVGYGTPTYRNSQYHNYERSDHAFTLSPRIFSPDHDGYHDYLLISYTLPEPGYVCNITLFSAAGEPVRYLARNALCGTEGYFKWDGLDEKNRPLKAGHYIMFAELFNLRGKKIRYKELLTLARKW